MRTVLSRSLIRLTERNTLDVCVLECASILDIKRTQRVADEREVIRKKHDLRPCFILANGKKVIDGACSCRKKHVCVRARFYLQPECIRGTNVERDTT